MSKVFIEESTLDDIANAIQKQEGSEAKIPTAEMAARILALGGGVNYLDYCERFGIWSLNLFGAPIVELTLPKATSLNAAFRVDKNASDTEGRTNITVEELIVHCPNTIVNMGTVFGQNNYYADKTIKRIVLDFETAANNWSYAFQNDRALEYIEGTPINLSFLNGDSRTISMFEQCYALKEVRFQGILSYSLSLQYSAKLTKASILSLMTCLSDEATGKAVTFSQTAVDTAFETSEGAADGSTSAEWLALVEAHSNWTISLV